jgi:DNA-binding PadR family transcriptional regulator
MESQLDEALRRLKQHGLIAGERGETIGFAFWMQLRVTADGLRVLGEWPPAEGGAINDALALVLRHLAPELPEDDATAARRAGSALAKMSAATVLDVVKDQAQRLGEDALG